MVEPTQWSCLKRRVGRALRLLLVANKELDQRRIDA
jgi:hypothetical protein